MDASRTARWEQYNDAGRRAFSQGHLEEAEDVAEAFYSGVTTLIGGGTGPATGTNATTCTPGAWHIRRMYEAVEAFPVEQDGQSYICLRDPSGIAPTPILVGPGAYFLVTLFDGTNSRLDLKAAFTRRFGHLLPPEHLDGLIEALEVCEKIEGIGVLHFGEKDVVRHNLVQQIIRAYEEYDVAHPQRGGNAGNGKAANAARESGKEQEKETQQG